MNSRADRVYYPHTPVLIHEVIESLRLSPGDLVVDGTAGSGAATESLCQAVGPNGRVIAIDQDPEAVLHCRARFSASPVSVEVVQASFAELSGVLDGLGLSEVRAVVLDLGVSSHQLEEGRGFSFRHDDALDMRMDTTQGDSAAELISRSAESELADILWTFSEERHSRRIARAICRARAEGPISTTGQLAQIIESAMPRRGQDKIHPATRSFMALRIAVNDELGVLERGLVAARDRLAVGGRLAVISYHSLEDRIVKLFIRREARGCTCAPRQPVCTCGLWPTLTPITRKPVRPTEAEVQANPRARSARLRVAERIEGQVESR